MSHIIPELLYLPLYGPTHQMRSIHPALPYIRFLKKGLRETLLCDRCEKILGRYESYFSSIWYGSQGLPNEIPIGVGKVMKSGLDYTLFKLFHLSILWRASISTLDEFREAFLDDNHKEKLREMLLTGNAEGVADYRLGASILLRPDSREVHGGVVSVPAPISHKEKWIHYSAIYGGCIWHYIVNRDMPVDIDILQEDGTLRMVVFDIRNIPAVSQSLARAATARRKKHHS